MRKRSEKFCREPIRNSENRRHFRTHTVINTKARWAD
jgi:hypothetical protein